MQFSQALLTSSLLALCIYASNSFALESDFSKPINVTSNRQVAELGKNTITFDENVIITQGTIRITADKLVVNRNNKGEISSITAYGQPATFKQTLENDKPLNSTAKTIHYSPIKQEISLQGNAEIMQENSKLNGEKIVYNIKTEKMVAEGGNNSNKRVTTVFIPDQLKSQVNTFKRNDKDKAKQ